MVSRVVGIELNGLIYSNNDFPEKEKESIIYSEDIGTRTYEYEGEDMAGYLKDFVKNNKIRTPGELTVNNQKYVFVMNTKKKCRLDAQKAAELNGYSVVFVEIHPTCMPILCLITVLFICCKQFTTKKVVWID